LLETTEDRDVIRVLLPAVLAAGRELLDLGVTVERQLDVLETMRAHARAVADEYVDLFDEAVLADWDARGRPAEEWPEVREAVDRIPPARWYLRQMLGSATSPPSVAGRSRSRRPPEDLRPVPHRPPVRVRDRTPAVTRVPPHGNLCAG
jgi:hypothetical protein